MLNLMKIKYPFSWVIGCV